MCSQNVGVVSGKWVSFSSNELNAVSGGLRGSILDKTRVDREDSERSYDAHNVEVLRIADEFKDE